MQKLKVIIPERMNGERLDVAIAEMLPDYSRSKITAKIKSGEALIDSKTFKPKDKASGKETVFLVVEYFFSNAFLYSVLNLSEVVENLQ